MTQRATNPPQDFQKMCKQAERDHETRKLVMLIERVKRQLEDRGVSPVTSPKPPLAVVISDGMRAGMPRRSSIFER